MTASVPGAVMRQYQGQPCTACSGEGGSTETKSDGTTLRQSWRPCPECRGRGKR